MTKTTIEAMSIDEWIAKCLAQSPPTPAKQDRGVKWWQEQPKPDRRPPPAWWTGKPSKDKDR